MADTKISALTDGATLNATDRLVVARSPFGSGDNRYVTPPYVGTYLVTAGTIREALAANRTYYVRTDGSDSNTGLVDSAGGAFLTIQKAVNVVAALDLSIYNVTIQVANGTYSAGISLAGAWVGVGAVTVLGDTTTPANVVISTTADCVSVTGFGSRLNVSGLKFVSSAGSALRATFGAFIDVTGKCDFGACSVGHMYVEFATIKASANYNITGGVFAHWLASPGGAIYVNSITITLSGTPAFSPFAFASRGAIMFVPGITFSGSATGSRYSVAEGSIISVNGAGANYLPGNSSGSGGTTSGGGFYV